MPSRRQIRETVVQFLYCADLEGGADPAALRVPFWEFVTESDRRKLQLATYRTIQHLSHGRDGRMEEFVHRQPAAMRVLAAYPEAESLKNLLERIAVLESSWSTALAAVERLPKEDDDGVVASRFSTALAAFFQVDRDLAATRARFLADAEDFPVLRGPLEPVAATIRRLQRVSDRIRMVENPENFPEQADLGSLRESRAELAALRQRADGLVDVVLANKESVDAALFAAVENYAPERVDPVDRAILRLATYELLHENLPVKVAINEAIEIAKRFGTTDSGRFVNGVLDRVAAGRTGV
ncbi:MAG: transcription antitermination factor NusB [Verrucomicrobiota bacterium]